MAKYSGPGRLGIIVHKTFRSECVFMIPVRFLLRLVLHLEIPINFFKNGLTLIHPYNVIIHPDVKGGKNLTVYNNVTIGTILSGKRKGVPELSDNVTVYPYSTIIGNIKIGKNVIIGAGSIVIHSVPDNCTVAGNPARIVRTIKEND